MLCALRKNQRVKTRVSTAADGEINWSRCGLQIRSP